MKSPPFQRFPSSFASARSFSAVLFAAFTALVVLGFGNPASSQEDASDVFGEVVDVRVINLEVVVTDKKGNRVSGLSPEDFVLKVDGAETPIGYFSEVLGGVAAPEGARPLQATTLPSLAAGEPVGTSYLVFIDDFYTIGAQRNRALKSLREELAFLGPDDRMAVVAFDGKRLSMLSSWSGSPRALEEAIDTAIERPAFGMFRNTERRRRGLTTRLGGISSRWEFQSQIDAMISALQGFAQPPGRKVMLLLAGGWPSRPLADFGDEIADGRSPRLDANDTVAFSRFDGFTTRLADQGLNPFLDRFGYRSDIDLLEEVSATANLLGYTLYPLDVPGLRDAGVDASNPRPAPLGASRSAISRDFERQGGLVFLARETGGRALLGGLRGKPLETVSEDTRSYYWLGFSADRAGDNTVHDVRLEARAKGFKVRTRRGFADLARTTEVTMLTRSALLFGGMEAIAAPSGLQVAAGEPRKSKRGRMEVPLEITVPVGDLTVVPNAEGWVTAVEVRIAVQDDDGAQAEIPTLPLRLDVPQEPEAEAVARYSTTLQLRRRPHDVVVSVHDPATGRILMSSLQVSW